jgi:hypothetical protein
LDGLDVAEAGLSRADHYTDSATAVAHVDQRADNLFGMQPRTTRASVWLNGQTAVLWLIVVYLAVVLLLMLLWGHAPASPGQNSGGSPGSD